MRVAQNATLMRVSVGTSLNKKKSQHKKLRWPIDYPLDSVNTMLSNVIKYTQPECELNQQVIGPVYQ